MENLEIEIWKDYPGYEGFYMVSNLGRVASFYTRNDHIGKMKKILKQKLQTYYKVTICKFGVKKDMLVHRMVATVFCENNIKSKYNQVNHIDGIKTNNRADNLEWCTSKMNRQHAYRTGLQVGLKGEKAVAAKLSDFNVSRIKLLLSRGVSCRKLTEVFGCKINNIYAIKNGYSWRSVD